MAEIFYISEIHLTFVFTEFNVLEKYRKSFNESALSRLRLMFPLKGIAKEICLLEQRLGHRNIFSPSSKVALMVWGLRWILRQASGGSSKRKYILLDVLQNHDRSTFTHTNYKIVCAINNKIASRIRRYWPRIGNLILTTFTCVWLMSHAMKVTCVTPQIWNSFGKVLNGFTGISAGIVWILL